MNGQVWTTRMKQAFKENWQFEANAKALAKNLAADRGGLSQAAFEEKRARTILEGMENATIGNQMAQNKAFDETRPVTHAVSGHGPDTDQVGRVLHGHRADEMAADAKKNAQPAGTVGVTIDGKAQATPDYRTVGSDPSNVSGAFTSGRAMLNTVKEAFAQADMVSRYAEGTKSGPEPSAAADARFATKITGVGEAMGYNLEVTGHSAQARGAALSTDEISERAKTVQRTDGLTTAQVVLDPAYVNSPTYDEKGNLIRDKEGAPVMEMKRAGWNLQTAYATKGTADGGFATPADVEGKPTDLQGKVIYAKRALDAVKAEVEAAEADLKRVTNELAAKQDVLKKTLERVGQPANEDDKNPEKVAAALEVRRKEIEKDKKDLEFFDDAPNLDFDAFDAGAEPASQEEKGTPPARDEGEIRDHLEAATKEERRLKGLQLVLQLTAELEALEVKRVDAEASVKTATEKLKPAQERFAKADLDAKPTRSDEDDESETEESAEGSGGGGKAGYDAGTGTYTGGRPPKPAALKGKDETGDTLTAHHLRPWNQIRDLLNDGLADVSGAKLKALFADSKVPAAKIPSSFWTELALPKEQRSYAFAETINGIAADLCWAPQNIFMGPLGEKRGDDPGEKVDAAFTRSGLPTARSAMVEMTDPDRVFAKSLAVSAVKARDDVAGTQDQSALVEAIVNGLSAEITKEVKRQDPKLKDQALEKAEKALRDIVQLEVGRAVSIAAAGHELDDGSGLEADRAVRDMAAAAVQKSLQAPETSDKLKTPRERTDLAYAIAMSLREAVGKKAFELNGPLAADILRQKIKAMFDAAHAEVARLLEAAAKGEAPGQAGGLNDRFQDRVHDAELGATGPRAYDPEEWELDKNGKRVRRGKIGADFATRAEDLVSAAEGELQAIAAIIQRLTEDKKPSAEQMKQAHAKASKVLQHVRLADPGADADTAKDQAHVRIAELASTLAEQLQVLQEAIAAV